MGMKKRLDTQLDRKKVTELLAELLAEAELPTEITEYIRELIRHALKASANNSDDDIKDLVRDFLSDYRIIGLTDDFAYDDRDYTDILIRLRYQDNEDILLKVRLSELLEFEDYVQAITIETDTTKELSNSIWNFFLHHRTLEREKEQDEIIKLD